ncbi:MAG: hypothetical protein A2133_11210 [Actinobacteria bacterium RBG_16_64_13]|nr:MAG: hypothetical protein A2133_11210 [Actinobacteria bacterium RBG_16_64_13]
MNDRRASENAGFDRLGDLLQDVTGAGDMPSGAPSARGGLPAGGGRTTGTSGGFAGETAKQLAQIWLDVVGEEVAGNSRPVQLRHGRLVVSASSSAWAQTLQFMSTAIIARLNERLGADTVKQAVFRHAGWVERPRRSPGAAEPGVVGGAVEAASEPAVCLTAEEQDALAAVEQLGLEPELRQKVIGAMRAAFVRGEQDSVR